MGTLFDILNDQIVLHRYYVFLNSMDRQKECLVHSSDQVVDLVLTVAKVTTLNKVIGDTSVTTIWCREFESPQEVIGALEVGSNGEDLVDQVLDGLETNVADVLLNNGIVVQSNALAIDLKDSSVKSDQINFKDFVLV